QALQGEREDQVQALLQTLPEEYREAVILRYWYEMSYEEIAEAMDTTVSAIKSRLFRARRDLAQAGIEMGLSTAV
ncbi:MAG: sigma-70 family RNA polymerase sigma factor, partial [Anaerolineales bacterium]|nr:sigma-70 family RNA polymerase sigma factor [Anaerolineales bacterium]